MSHGAQKSFSTLLIDVVLVLAATVLAVVVRDNFALSAEKVVALLPYFVATALATTIVFTSARIPRSIWRFASAADASRVALSVVLVVLLACLGTFAWDRLEHVSRSLPIIQIGLAIGLLLVSRLGFRNWRRRRQERRRSLRVLSGGETGAQRNVLIVGVTRLAECYLLSVEEFAPREVRVIGVLDQREHHVSRLLAGLPVLGQPQDVRDVLADLEVHGVAVDRIVVACSLTALSEPARQALFALEAESTIEVQVLAVQLGLTPAQRPEKKPRAAPARFAIGSDRVAANQKRVYWSVKRAVDVVAAGVLLVALSPVMALTALALALSVGFPILFWQQRPGLAGRPFRLYKWRTMRPAHDPAGRPLTDAERTSPLGDFIRRTRLDELPQLYNILCGDMSFIGPRPLLPRDQSDSDRARLLVRPGLTGWAQVTGGRTISAEDKAALDVWYVQNASLMLDFQILLRTIPLVVFGERVSRDDIERAWRDLTASGIVIESPRPAVNEAA